MSEPKERNLTDKDSTDTSKVEYANGLYQKVMDLCQDWGAVDETKAQLIIECGQDALKAFGDTNQEKRVELKEILQRAEQLISPDSIDAFKRRSERMFLKTLLSKNKVLRRPSFIILCWLAAVSVPVLIGLISFVNSYRTETNNASQPQVHQEPITAKISPSPENDNAASQQVVPTDDEPGVIIGNAAVTLDLTSSWVELDRYQRENERTSRGILRGVFTDVRKIKQDAKFIHRVGTTSNFHPEWRAISPHSVTHEDQTERKCDPRAKYAALLYFDISKERLDVPFNLQYEIVFWNAHNGEAGDWQSFFVSRPTNQLIFKVSFPRNKPYKRLHFKHAYGIRCQTADFKDFPNPQYEESTDPKTGAKVMTWTIASPQVYWIYMIGWDW